MNRWILIITVIVLSACNSSHKGKWSDEDKKQFLSDVSSVKELNNYGDNKQKWIDRYLQKCEANYESYEDANADESGVEKIAMQCTSEVLANGSVKGNWSEKDKQSFMKDMNEVVDSENFGPYKNEWINCYLNKCQAKYSSYYEANKDTAGCTKLAYECNDAIFKSDE
ncbi:MAG: hypothetical protein ACKOX3_10175 [Bacteroidota bacterium]